MIVRLVNIYSQDNIIWKVYLMEIDVLYLLGIWGREKWWEHWKKVRSSLPGSQQKLSPSEEPRRSS